MVDDVCAGVIEVIVVVVAVGEGLGELEGMSWYDWTGEMGLMLR